MSLAHDPSPAELRDTLEQLLANPRRAKVPSETGFNDATLAAVQSAWTDGGEADAARAALERQISLRV